MGNFLVNLYKTNLTWINPFNNPTINLIIFLNHLTRIWLNLNLFLNK